MSNIRGNAFKILEEVLHNGGYSNLLLQNVQVIKKEDRSMLTRLVYGTLQNYLRYDIEITKHLKKEKLSSKARLVCALTLFQIEHMDRVPKYAIFNEAKLLCKQFCRREFEKINVILNVITKDVLEAEVANKLVIINSEQNNKHDKKNLVDALSYTYSFPTWIVALVLGQTKSKEKTIEFLDYQNTAPSVVFRQRDMSKPIKNEHFVRGTYKTALVYSGSDFMTEQEVINNELVIQDEASQRILEFLPEVNTTIDILDMCAAPGGKSFLIKDFYKEKCNLVANDIFSHKLKLIEERAKQLDIEVETTKFDATTISSETDEKFDVILCDVPCSGLGVIRRRPEIRYNMSGSDLDELQKIQEKILTEAYQLLKSDGVIIYSTCTVNSKENEKHFENDLRFQLGKTFHTLGFETKSDGFFIQSLKKARN